MTVTEITFGEYEQSEFSLFPAGVTISPPEAQTYQVSVPGRDGDFGFYRGAGWNDPLQKSNGYNGNAVLCGG